MADDERLDELRKQIKRDREKYGLTGDDTTDEEDAQRWLAEIKRIDDSVPKGSMA